MHEFTMRPSVEYLWKSPQKSGFIKRHCGHQWENSSGAFGIFKNWLKFQTIVAKINQIKNLKKIQGYVRIVFSMKPKSIKTPKDLSNPKYQGKHVVILGDKVIAAGPWKKASKIVDKIWKEKKVMPGITYIPKAETLILIL